MRGLSIQEQHLCTTWEILYKEVVTPCASTTPWLSFSPGVSSAALPSTPIGLPSQSSPRGSGQSGNTATFGMPPGFLDSGPTQAPTPAVDPVMAQLLRQQMLLTQGVMDLLNRSEPGLPQQQQPVQQTPTAAQSSTAQSERLTMDTKWIPAAPLPGSLGTTGQKS